MALKGSMMDEVEQHLEAARSALAVARYHMKEATEYREGKQVPPWVNMLDSFEDRLTNMEAFITGLIKGRAVHTP